MSDARTPPPGLTRKQWRRILNDKDTAQPALRTGLGIIAEQGAKAVNRQTRDVVKPGKGRKE